MKAIMKAKKEDLIMLSEVQPGQVFSFIDSRLGLAIMSDDSIYVYLEDGTASDAEAKANEKVMLIHGSFVEE